MTTDKTKALIVFKENNESLSANSPSISKKLIKNQIDTLNLLSILNAQKFIFYSEFIERDDIMEFDNWIKIPQYGNSFAGKLKDAFSLVKSGEYSKIIFINSLTQNLDPNLIEDAFIRLELNDVVVGLNSDNTCYLLGFSKLNDYFFENKEWHEAPNFKDIEAESNKFGFVIEKLSKTLVAS